MLDGSFLNDQTQHVFWGFGQTLFSFACDFEELLCLYKFGDNAINTQRVYWGHQGVIVT